MKFQVSYEVDVNVKQFAIEYGLSPAEAFDFIKDDLKEWAGDHFRTTPKWSGLVEGAEFHDVRVVCLENWYIERAIDR